MWLLLKIECYRTMGIMSGDKLKGEFYSELENSGEKR